MPSLYPPETPSCDPSTTNLLANANHRRTLSRPLGASVRSHDSLASISSFANESPYPSRPNSSPITIPPSIEEKFFLNPDPYSWNSDLNPHPDDDDFPDPKRDRTYDDDHCFFTRRGIMNLGCVVIVLVSLLALFVGYPVISYLTKPSYLTYGGFNIGGINASGQVPFMPNGNFYLIDLDTPRSVYKRPSYADGKEWQLVFSDEFNVEGRTFYPGDDPIWEAADLHCQLAGRCIFDSMFSTASPVTQTNNLEWYDPAAITTKNGALEITLSKKNTHGMHYQGGLLTSWNRFCITGGRIEASVSLPGANNIVGLWPAIWTMGNLGRAGYGGSLEGVWPYSYDACDVGTVPNQTMNGLPVAATINGDPWNGNVLSYLPGQRLSRCTCSNDKNHPGPRHSDGTFVGRSAPEIDIFEAQITGEPLSGQVSQSLQAGPFNAQYAFFNTSENFVIYDAARTSLNAYHGGVFQQTLSAVTETDQNCYERGTGCFSVYGFEYKPGFENAYITWISEDKPSWTLKQSGMGADTQVEISSRPIPQEPMYILMNLGMSMNFGIVDLEHLHFPLTMRVDWIRIYQSPDALNIGCDPKEFPTQSYIERFSETYTNPNLTTFRGDYNQPFPKNSFMGQC